MSNAIGFPPCECYDGARDRAIVAGGQVMFAGGPCLQVGPCGMCEEFCPTGVLQLAEIGQALPGAVCIRCRVCLAICPVGALSFVS